MDQKKYSWRKFFQLLISAKPANWIIFCALFASVITTVAGLVVPLFTKNLIDGFSIASLDVKMIALIVLAFVLQAITNGFSIFLLNYMGQKVVATIRERLWKKIVHLPVSYFDNTKTGEW